MPASTLSTASSRQTEGMDRKHDEEFCTLVDKTSDAGVFVPSCSTCALPLLLQSISNLKPNFLMHPNPTGDFHGELVTLIKQNVEDKMI
jgi:hypothetical protein